jgi:hypothetical protein
MNLTNLACTATLAWILVFSSNELEQSKTLSNDTPHITVKVKPKEVAVEQEEAPANVFPRPRRPCPSGPGKQ